MRRKQAVTQRGRGKATQQEKQEKNRERKKTIAERICCAVVIQPRVCFWPRSTHTHIHTHTHTHTHTQSAPQTQARLPPLARNCNRITTVWLHALRHGEQLHELARWDARLDGLLPRVDGGQVGLDGVQEWLATVLACDEAVEQGGRRRGGKEKAM